MTRQLAKVMRELNGPKWSYRCRSFCRLLSPNQLGKRSVVPGACTGTDGCILHFCADMHLFLKIQQQTQQALQMTHSMVTQGWK